MLDMVAAMTSLGNATHAIANDPLKETGLSQMFVAIDPRGLGDASRMEEIAEEVVESLHRSRPAETGKDGAVPGRADAAIARRESQARAAGRRLCVGRNQQNVSWSQGSFGCVARRSKLQRV